MQLNSFLQLSNDLNKNYLLFYRPGKTEKSYPLSKFTITSSGAYFLTGNLEKTLASFYKTIMPLHHKDLSLMIKHQNKNAKIYGVQIAVDQQKIYLF